MSNRVHPKTAIGYPAKFETREGDDTLGLVPSLLALRSGDKPPIFNTKWHLFLFAATFGFVRGGPVPNSEEPKTKKTIEWQIFTRNSVDDVFRAIALAHTQDIKILAPARLAEVLDIVERCAHRGLDELQHIWLKPGDPFEEILQEIYGVYSNPVEYGRSATDTQQQIMASLPISLGRKLSD